MTALVVVGASYIWFSGDINPVHKKDKKIGIENRITYQSTGKSDSSEIALSSGDTTQANDSILIAPSVAVSSELQAEVSFQNTSLALRNTNTIAMSTA